MTHCTFTSMCTLQYLRYILNGFQTIVKTLNRLFFPATDHFLYEGIFSWYFSYFLPNERKIILSDVEHLPPSSGGSLFTPESRLSWSSAVV